MLCRDISRRYPTAFTRWSVAQVPVASERVPPLARVSARLAQGLATVEAVLPVSV